MSEPTQMDLLQGQCRLIDHRKCIAAVVDLTVSHIFRKTAFFIAVKDSLQKDGRLDKFKAELRSAVMSVLSKSSGDSEAPKIPDETRFLNELIREYLSWNGYLYTEQILSAESGQATEKMSRDVLSTKLGVIDDPKTAKIPLLYYIVSAFQSNGDDDNEEL